MAGREKNLRRGFSGAHAAYQNREERTGGGGWVTCACPDASQWGGVWLRQVRLYKPALFPRCEFWIIDLRQEFIAAPANCPILHPGCLISHPGDDSALQIVPPRSRACLLPLTVHLRSLGPDLPDLDRFCSFRNSNHNVEFSRPALVIPLSLRPVIVLRRPLDPLRTLKPPGRHLRQVAGESGCGLRGCWDRKAVITCRGDIDLFISHCLVRQPELLLTFHLHHTGRPESSTPVCEVDWSFGPLHFLPSPTSADSYKFSFPATSLPSTITSHLRANIPTDLRSSSDCNLLSLTTSGSRASSLKTIDIPALNLTSRKHGLTYHSSLDRPTGQSLHLSRVIVLPRWSWRLDTAFV